MATVSPSLFFNEYCTTALNFIMNPGCESFFTTFGKSDIFPADLAKMQADCTAFLAFATTLLNQGDSARDAGSFFWLTRNNYGSGYFAGRWPSDVANELTWLAQSYHESRCYMDNDGIIRVAP